MGLRTQAGESPPTRTSGAEDPLVGQLLDGRYRLTSLLAQGGMGKVYRAEQLSLGRQVAIKTLHLNEQQAGHDPSFRQRFALEAAATSRLSNPHTVTIFDYGRTDADLYYIVMELVDGSTLSQLMRQEGRLTPARALNITRQIVLALREAHRRGIVHRDIKPANILLIRDGLETVKVLDFGIAKILQPEPTLSAETPMEITRSGTLLGTPEYMAPEAMTGRADARSDLYSLGVVLYLMLSGKLPFKGASPSETIMMVLHEKAPKLPPELGLPPTLVAMVEKLMASQPNQRFQSVDELWATLIPLSQGLGVEFAQLTQPRLDGLELEPELLLPLTHAGEMPVGWSYAWLPAWLRTRRQLGALLTTAGLVLLAGGGLWWFSSPRVSSETPIRSATSPSSSAAPISPALQPATPAASDTQTAATSTAVASPHPTAPAQSAPEERKAAAATPSVAASEAALPVFSPATEAAEPVKRASPRKKVRSPSGLSPVPSEEEALPEGYKPSPY